MCSTPARESWRSNPSELKFLKCKKGSSLMSFLSTASLQQTTDENASRKLVLLFVSIKKEQEKADLNTEPLQFWEG
jgi:hypothetical protein